MDNPKHVTDEGKHKAIMNEHEDTKVIKSNVIIFERLVNIGNYENVKFGGHFVIPEGLSNKEALKLVVKQVQDQIDVFKSSKHFASVFEPEDVDEAKEQLNVFI